MSGHLLTITCVRSDRKLLRCTSVYYSDIWWKWSRETKKLISIFWD